jgi:hypothetical protein
MLDPGSVGRLDPGTREALQRFLLAVDHGDLLVICAVLVLRVLVLVFRLPETRSRY